MPHKLKEMQIEDVEKVTARKGCGCFWDSVTAFPARLGLFPTKKKTRGQLSVAIHAT